MLVMVYFSCASTAASALHGFSLENQTLNPDITFLEPPKIATYSPLPHLSLTC